MCLLWLKTSIINADKRPSALHKRLKKCIINWNTFWDWYVYLMAFRRTIMITLSKGGAYLLNGNEVIEVGDDSEEI